MSKQLGIEQMVTRNRESFKTDFQVSVDAAEGITTGISAVRTTWNSSTRQGATPFARAVRT